MASVRRLTVFDAVRQNNIDELRRHLSMGINAETSHDAEEKRTLLHWAAWARNISIVELLLNIHPTRIDYLDIHGNKPQDLCDTDEESITIRRLLAQYQNWLNNCVYQTASPSQKNACRWKTTRLQAFPHHRSEYDTIHLQLARKSTNHPNVLERWFDVKPIHTELSANMNDLVGTAGNNVCAALTFQISIDGNKHTGITIPIKVPCNYMIVHSKVVYGRIYTRTQAEQDVNGKKYFLDLVRYYDWLGRTVANRANIIHGQQPSYQQDETTSMQRFINHSEKTLAVYLSTEKAAIYFLSALESRLRSTYFNSVVSKVRIYSITLHIHSTKTPCGSCEFVLVGLMNASRETSREAGVICMREQFQNTFEKNAKYYKFIFGENQEDGRAGSFNMFTTFTANGDDNTHQKAWDYTPTHYTDLDPTDLETDNYLNSLFIFVCRFRHFIRKDFTNLFDYTIFVSASNGNSGIPKKCEPCKKHWM